MRLSGYGLIGDGRAAALVSREGSIDWCCFPRFDSPSCFGAILDAERGGAFSIQPVGPFQSVQAYLPDTNVLETWFSSGSAKARLMDSFSVASEESKRGRLRPGHEVLRVLEGLEGETRFRVSCAPRPGYGNPEGRFRLADRGRAGLACEYGDNLLLLRSSLPPGTLAWSDGRCETEFTLRAGRRVIFSLLHADEAPAVIPPLGEQALSRLEETARYWKRWVSRCRYRGPYTGAVRRSALALKLLVFAPSGAVVAAPTTSLPESPGGPRNWDYRYCWLRDASFTVRALVDLGFEEEALAFSGWMLHTTRLTHPRLQVVYTVTGESRIRERELGWLEGCMGSRPVRAGNAAADQFQLDVYGEVLDAFYQCRSLHGSIDGDTRNFLLGLGRSIAALWERPDQGIWEVRSGPAHHTFSKVMAWTGLDRIIRLARAEGWRAPLDRWASTAKAVRDAVESRGFNRSLKTYTRTLDGDDLDASLLVLPLVGYCRAGDPRMTATRDAVARTLGTDGLIRRYLAPDGLRGEEGCFGICTFWLAEGLARAGRAEEAKGWMDAVLRRANGVGLWPEEIDPGTGAFLGNYPQAFTHIGLINAAVAMERAEAA